MLPRREKNLKMEQFVNLKQLKYIYNISTAETILKGNLKQFMETTKTI